MLQELGARSRTGSPRGIRAHPDPADLSYADAAAVCGCPIGTIRSRVARARADLVTGLDTGSVPDPIGEPKLDVAGQ